MLIYNNTQSQPIHIRAQRLKKTEYARRSLPERCRQRLVAERVVKLGAGRMADRKNVPQVMVNLLDMLESATYRNAAQRFAATYAKVDPVQQFNKMMSRIEALLSARLASVDA